MARYLFYFIIIFTLQLYYANSANVLGLFSHPGRSHHMVIEPLLRKLTERGHNLTIASFFPAKNVSSHYRDINLQGLANIRLESYDLASFESEPLLYKIPRIGRIAKQVLNLETFKTGALIICERLVKHQPLLDALKDDYDVVLVEMFFSDCMVGLLNVYGIKAPVVSIITCSSMPWSPSRIGNNDNPSYVPVITTNFGSQMSFLDRVENTILNVILKHWYSDIEVKEREILQNKYGNVPHLYELTKNTALALVNGYHTLNGVKPLVPGLVEVGGMHLSTERKPIPQFIEKFLNESIHGVILFSFGSHIKTKSMPKYKEQIFMKVLSKLKQRVIWKFEDSDVDGTLVGNVLKVRWLPQYDLLRHEKIIAFICHGGMLGMTEAMSAGKPMIVVPIFGDQPLNAAAAAEAGVGVELSYLDLTKETLEDALKRVLSEEMQLHTRRMSQIWHDRELAPLERAVFWTEHVMRWGTTRLHSTARDLPFYQLALLDVAAFIIFIIITLLTIVIYFILKVINIFRKGIKEKVN